MMNQSEAQRSYPEPGQGSAGGMEAMGSINPKEVLGMVEGFARENPHTALVGACAIGFLLGGGLTPRILGSLAVIAGRKYFNQTMRETLEGVLREQLGTQDA
jgi:hypothetical protein